MIVVGVATLILLQTQSLITMTETLMLTLLYPYDFLWLAAAWC